MVPSEVGKLQVSDGVGVGVGGLGVGGGVWVGWGWGWQLRCKSVLHMSHEAI